jgi:hypothetical protein
MARNVESVIACYTPDISYDESPMMMPTALHGPEAVSKYWTKVFEAFSSIRTTTTSFTTFADGAWVEWTLPSSCAIWAHGTGCRVPGLE